MSRALTAEEISGLFAAPEPKYAAPEQKGPFRISDREERCTERRCSSPTYYKINGAPKCAIHALRQLNEMVLDKEYDVESELRQVIEEQGRALMVHESAFQTIFTISSIDAVRRIATDAQYRKDQS